MRRSNSEGCRDLAPSSVGNARLGALFAGALLAGACFAAPASAQWIGAPGGGGATVTEPTVPPAQMQMAPAAPTPGASMQGAPPIMPSGPMSMPAPGGMTMPGGGAPDQANAADMQECQTSVEGLRKDLEKRGAALQGATGKKLPPSELCPMFRSFVSAQQKFFSYLSTNQTKCHVPPDVVKKVKENANQVASVRDRVCKAAQLQESGGGGGGGGGGPPLQGAVSSGLGLPTGLPSTTTASQPGGVFDTLGGNALR